MNAKFLMAMRSIFLTLLISATVVVNAQGCGEGGVWQPMVVEYVPPARGGGMATLIFGPPPCAFFFAASSPFPPTMSVVGQEITLRAPVSDTLGIGVVPPPATVDIPIARLPDGDYRLRTHFEPDGDRTIPDTVLTLSVRNGAPMALPINSLWLMMGVVGLLLLTASARLRRSDSGVA
jgi:hypothetical protein